MRNWISAIIFVFAFSTAFAGGGSDGKSVAVQGKVADAANHETLAGAKVELPSLGITVYCDFDGNFEIPALPPGNYEIRITMLSYNQAVYSDVRVGGKNKVKKFFLESR